MLFHILNVKRRLCIQKSTLKSHGSLLWRKPDFAVSTQKTFKITQSFLQRIFSLVSNFLKNAKKSQNALLPAFPFPASLKCMAGFSLIIDDQRGAIRVENIQFSLHCTIHIKNTNLYSWIQIQENNKRQMMQLCFRMYFCIHYIHTCNGYYSPKVDVVWQYRK